ncbi:MMPL family transporter [Actinophytocola gossypii]|uniref:MMPL family transporter n=1 Tax=Actinophytocola gossypii TaxID=2812003 RepID=A0ABT2JFZ6_9PSEU|nr:MMPL family transporter [Actinophytocola gossypii]MCT2586797.1 MMPL family transporter [Actinophytocola gossypii]
MVGAWLVLLMLAGPLAGKLTGVQKNDTAEWLPSDAESTQVYELQERFQTTETAPAIIVFERSAGITSADEATVAAFADRLAGVDGVTGEVVGPIPAEDGEALQLVVPVEMGDDGWAKTATRVDEMRGIVGEGGDGLATHITGPVGISADQSSVFEGADFSLMFITVLIIVGILLFAYRSPVLWLLPVLSAGAALTIAQAVIYGLARGDGLTVTGQGASILMVLVLGAGTDYALLLIARYREELTRTADRHVAMGVALRRATPAIVASAATVVIAMLCLTFADMSSTASLGPVVAIGIAVGLLAMLTLLPALLVIVGRWVFWPKKPKIGVPEAAANNRWARLGASIARRPRTVWIGTAGVLAVLTIGVTSLNAGGLSAADGFVGKPDSIVGQEVLGRHFDGGNGQPVVVVADEASAARVEQTLTGTEGIAEVSDPVVADGLVQLTGSLTEHPDSDSAKAAVETLRAELDSIEGADARVGGYTATQIDLTNANQHDNRLIIPLVLVVVLLVLGFLLRAIVAPLVLVATVVLSFGAALGISAVVFENVFGFAGVDSSFPLLAFIWLVALGIDYNIFLMHRVREETQLGGPTSGALTGLATTGRVITSAGLVMAGTFAALASMPLVFFAELGFAVALGVLIDTFVVRSILVTGLSLDLGRWMWWPSELARKKDVSGSEHAGREPALTR